MKKVKYFLAQFLVQVDVTERPDFDDMQASDYFSSAFQLSDKDKKVEIKVYPLAVKPESRHDVTVETYEYRGLNIEILQSAHTVGTDIPLYFGVVSNPLAKQYSGSVVTRDIDSIEETKRLAQVNADKRITRMQKKTLT